MADVQRALEQALAGGGYHDEAGDAPRGDAATVQAELEATARFLVREDFLLSGLELLQEVRERQLWSKLQVPEQLQSFFGDPEALERIAAETTGAQGSGRGVAQGGTGAGAAAGAEVQAAGPLAELQGLPDPFATQGLVSAVESREQQAALLKFRLRGTRRELAGAQRQLEEVRRLRGEDAARIDRLQRAAAAAAAATTTTTTTAAATTAPAAGDQQLQAGAATPPADAAPVGAGPAMTDVERRALDAAVYAYLRARGTGILAATAAEQLQVDPERLGGDGGVHAGSLAGLTDLLDAGGSLTSTDADDERPALLCLLRHRLQPAADVLQRAAESAAAGRRAAAAESRSAELEARLADARRQLQSAQATLQRTTKERDEGEAKLAALRQAAAGGDDGDEAAAATPREPVQGAEGEASLLRVVCESTPGIVKQLPARSRVKALPLLAAAAAGAPSRSDRRTMLKGLLTITGRPRPEERQAILAHLRTVCRRAAAGEAALASVSEEVVPLVLELAAQRARERRCVAAEAVGLLAPFCLETERGVDPLCAALAMLADDRSEEVRRCVVKGATRLAASLVRHAGEAEAQPDRAVDADGDHATGGGREGLRRSFFELVELARGLVRGEARVADGDATRASADGLRGAEAGGGGRSGSSTDATGASLVAAAALAAQLDSGPVGVEAGAAGSDAEVAGGVDVAEGGSTAAQLAARRLMPTLVALAHRLGLLWSSLLPGLVREAEDAAVDACDAGGEVEDEAGGSAAGRLSRVLAVLAAITPTLRRYTLLDGFSVVPLPGEVEPGCRFRLQARLPRKRSAASVSTPAPASGSMMQRGVPAGVVCGVTAKQSDAMSPARQRAFASEMANLLAAVLKGSAVVQKLASQRRSDSAAGHDEGTGEGPSAAAGGEAAEASPGHRDNDEEKGDGDNGDDDEDAWEAVPAERVVLAWPSARRLLLGVVVPLLRTCATAPSSTAAGRDVRDAVAACLRELAGGLGPSFTSHLIRPLLLLGLELPYAPPVASEAAAARSGGAVLWRSLTTQVMLLGASDHSNSEAHDDDGDPQSGHVGDQQDRSGAPGQAGGSASVSELRASMQAAAEAQASAATRPAVLGWPAHLPELAWLRKGATGAAAPGGSSSGSNGGALAEQLLPVLGTAVLAAAGVPKSDISDVLRDLLSRVSQRRMGWGAAQRPALEECVQRACQGGTRSSGVVLEVLSRVGTSPDEQMRKLAAQLLQRLGQTLPPQQVADGVLPALLPLCRDADGAVQRTAVRGLAALYGARAAEGSAVQRRLNREVSQLLSAGPQPVVVEVLRALMRTVPVCTPALRDGFVLDRLMEVGGRLVAAAEAGRSALADICDAMTADGDAELDLSADSAAAQAARASRTAAVQAAAPWKGAQWDELGEAAMACTEALRAYLPVLGSLGDSERGLWARAVRGLLQDPDLLDDGYKSVAELTMGEQAGLTAPANGGDDGEATGATEEEGPVAGGASAAASGAGSPTQSPRSRGGGRPRQNTRGEAPAMSMDAFFSVEEPSAATPPGSDAGGSGSGGGGGNGSKKRLGNLFGLGRRRK